MHTRSPSEAVGFCLLTLEGVRLSIPPTASLGGQLTAGRLSLECITVPLAKTDYKEKSPLPNDQSERDVWLLLRLNEFELALSPTDPILHSRAKRTFEFTAPEGRRWIISLRHDVSLLSDGEKEDEDTFEVLLSQYGILKETDPAQVGDDRDLKGRLVLVDEDDGEVLGTLGDQFTIREDPNVGQDAKAPVVIEMPEEGQRELYVQRIDPNEQDFILKSAQFVSRGIIFATDMIGKGMGLASDYYVKNTKPNPEPMVFSETTRTNLRRFHKVTATTVEVSSKTTGLIHNLVDRVADKVGGSSKPSSSRPPSTPAYAYQGAPPPLPSRGGDKRLGGGGPPPIPPRAPSPAGQPAPSAPKRLLNKLLISTDLLLTTVENSAQSLITHTTDSLSASLGHKYGAEMGGAVKTIGSSAKNVGIVYIDVRGVGRRALIKRVGKRVIKGRMGNKEVVLGADGVHEDGTVLVNGVPSSSASSSSANLAPPGYYKSKTQ